MSLKALGRRRGTAPIYAKGVSDASGVLKKSALKKLNRECQSYHRLFPQSEIHFVLSGFYEDLPLPATLVWLFNEAGFCSKNNRGGRNFDLLIGINTKTHEAAAVVGYGLEMLAKPDFFTAPLEEAAPLLAARKWEDAVQQIIDEFSTQLQDLSSSLQDVIGSSKPFAVEPSVENY